MAEKKYQIFVSSTYEDLKEERNVVLEAILRMKHLPASMERFSASSNEQMKYITKIIDDSDYYILIIGDRYGSINEEMGISYTEQEYDYAISKGIPVLVFWKEKNDKTKQDNPEKLEKFKQKVLTGRLCRPWNNITELQAEVFPSIMDEINENPQQGWTRGGGEDNAELLKELNDLRKEKDTLKNKILEMKAESQAHTYTKVEGLAGMDEEFEIEGKIGPFVNSTCKKIKCSWNEIFSLIAPYLGSPKVYNSFSLESKKAIEKYSGYLTFSFTEDYIQTIKIQLEAQGLIKVYQAQAVKGGVHEFIELTEKGKQYLMQIKTVKSKKEGVTP